MYFQYPYLEARGNVPDALKKTLLTYENVSRCSDVTVVESFCASERKKLHCRATFVKKYTQPAMHLQQMNKGAYVHQSHAC